MRHLLRRFWTKATRRRVEPNSGSARRGGLNVEQLETRSMLSAMPLDLDASYDFVLGRKVDEPTSLPEHRPSAINRQAGGLPIEFGRIIISPTQTGSVIPLWPNVKFPTNSEGKISVGSEQGGFVRNSGLNAIFDSFGSVTLQVQPAIEQEIRDVHELISGLGFAVNVVKEPESILTTPFEAAPSKVEVAPPKTEVLRPTFEAVTSKLELATPRIEVATPKLEKPEPLTSPAIREKPTSKLESAATRAPVTSQPLVQFVDDAEGGMVTLGYHKVGDQSAMLTATSAANVESILDREVQFDRAYGTFQAFEVSSGEAPVQTPTPISGTTPPTAKPIGTTSEQIQRPDVKQAKPAIGGISFLPALDALTIDLGASASRVDLASANVKLDEACVDAVFSAAATEEQYEQSIGNPSLFQLIMAIAVATVVHRTQATRAAEPDKSAGTLPTRQR
jgi:hypothetical protein